MKLKRETYHVDTLHSKDYWGDYWGKRERYLDDGFGNKWVNECYECGAELQIVRPGKVQCTECGY